MCTSLYSVEQTLVPCVLVSSTPRSCASGGELIQDVWDRWLAFDPVVNVHDRLDNLRQLSGILLDGGPNDDYNLHWGHRLLSHYLDEAGIAHEHRENPGNHGGRANERYQVALEWLSHVLERD